MQRVKVWDPLVRIFHWTVVAGFLGNAFVFEGEASLHRKIGYMILAALIVRIVWGFVGSRHARFADFPPNPGAALDHVRDLAIWRRNAHAGHSPLGALMIYNLILSLLAIILTGWMMTTDRWWGIEWVEDTHKFLVTWAEFSVFAHVSAVFVESLRLRVNLPKSMIVGYKDLPPTDG